MDIITKEELKTRMGEIANRIHNGEVFIYPTDTIYGLGCDATNSQAVQKLMKIKPRNNVPYSIIVPSISWIKENCTMTKDAEKYLKQLPGPITLILKLKNPKCVAKEVNSGIGTLGVRIPNHWAAAIVGALRIPIITTSVNKTGEPYMTSLEDLDPEIRSHVSFCIYEGEKKGRASTIIHLEGEEVKIRER